MQGSASLFDQGRFGPVYRSQDPATHEPVLIRTFVQPLGPDEQDRLVAALTRLCTSPLDHPSIGRPISAGIEEGRPFLIHTLLPGVSLQRFLEEHGRQPFSEVVVRVTQLAAAIDFAAAAGVHHGDLGPLDVIVGPESCGISGFGVMQALHEAGIAMGRVPTHADDIQALGRVALALLTGRWFDTRDSGQSLVIAGADSARLRAAFAGVSSDRPESRPAAALAFAAALQGSIVAPADAEAALGTSPPPAAGVPDLPLRPEHEARPRAADVSILPMDPVVLRPDPAPEAPGTKRVVSPPEPALRAEHAAVLPPGTAHAVQPHDEGSRTGWFLVAAALAVGVLAGFIGGFIVGQRSDVPIPRFAADLLDGRGESNVPRAAPDTPQGTTRDARGAEPAAEAPASGPASPAGVPDTGANMIQQPEISSGELEAGSSTAPSGAPRPEVPPTLPPGAAAEPPAEDRVAAPSVGDPRGSGANTTGRSAGEPPRESISPRVPSNTPGGLQILSRPEGAQVFLDGVLVGRTPLVIPSVAAGPHDVRLELTGHRTWGRMVRVAPGERARVAASLEQ